MIFTKKSLITEVLTLAESSDYRDAWDTFNNIYDNQKDKILSEIIDGKEHEYWEKIKFPRLQRIWEGYMRLKFIRDVKGMDDIAYLCIRNIAKLLVNTELVGHTEQYPENIINEFLEDRNLCFKTPVDLDAPIKEPTDPKQLKIKYRDHKGKFWSAYPPKNEPIPNDCQEIAYTKEEFFERLDNYIGYDTYSDYALKPLVSLAYDLIEAATPEEQLLICDHIFNVIHMRGDIAALFVDGGSNALSKLSGEHHDVDVHRPMEEAYPELARIKVLMKLI